MELTSLQGTDQLSEESWAMPSNMSCREGFPGPPELIKRSPLQPTAEALPSYLIKELSW